jgi:hypothetical protein
MKKLKTTRALFIFFLVPLHTLAYSMDIAEDITYLIGTPLITVAQCIKAHGELIAYTCLPHHRERAIQKIQQQRSRIEQELKQDEANAIKALYEDFNVPEQQQEMFGTLNHQYEQFEKQWLISPHDQFFHDENFPKEIFPILKRNGLQPSALDLEFSSEFSCAAAIGIRFNTHSDNYLMKQNVKKQPTIEINPQPLPRHPLYLLYKTNVINAILIHEVGHLQSHHYAKKLFLISCIRYCTNAAQQEITNNKNYQRLKIIMEQQAEIFPAIKDHESASILQFYRSFDKYPNTLHLRHYAHLCTIDNGHRLERKLKDKRIPLQKIPTIHNKPRMEW